MHDSSSDDDETSEDDFSVPNRKRGGRKKSVDNKGGDPQRTLHLATLQAVKEGREKYMQEAHKICMGPMVENTDEVEDDVESDDNCVLDESDL